MADGFLCKHCGFQEADHEEIPDISYRHGYRSGVPECSGFEIAKQDEKEFSKLRAEREAEESWAGEVWTHRAENYHPLFMALYPSVAQYARMARV